MLGTTLIIDKRKEMSVKYKKNLTFSENKVFITSELTSAMKILQAEEPDLILVSDSIDENLAEFCKQIRVLTFNMRPVIVALSKSADIQDRLSVLEAGADDFISEPVNSEEFKMRIFAHLRRERESNADVKTQLPSKTYSVRAIKRVIASEEKWAAIAFSIENFQNYKENYSELASDKILQSFCAILNSTLNEDDFFGMFTDENSFLVLTNPTKAEKIAAFVSFAFESIVKKFYSQEDVNRGYMIIKGDEYEGRRAEFVKITAGIVGSDVRSFENVQDIINSLKNNLSIARNSKNSIMIERPKISAKNSVCERSFNKKVLILEKDEALSLLLQTVLNLQNFDVSIAQMGNQVDGTPAVLILDAGNVESKLGLDLCRAIKENTNFVGTKIIVTSVFHDKEIVLNAGADLYLPKPYELSTLVSWVKKFIDEFNS